MAQPLRRTAAAALLSALIAVTGWGCGSSSGSDPGGDASDDASDTGLDQSTDVPGTDTANDGSELDGSPDGDTPLVSGPSGQFVWDFEDGTLQGFASVFNDSLAGMGVNNVISPGYGLEPVDFGQRDSHHDLVLLRSREFYLDASQDVRALTTGGVGDGSQPADADALADDTQSAGPHPLGIAVRRAADGAYVAVGNLSEINDAGFSDIVIPASELGEADGELVFLDVIDAFGGQDWSWFVIDDIRAQGWAAAGACARQPCAEGVACTEEPGRFPGFSCETGGCDETPCFAGVVCTDRPGEAPDFACGDCPEGFSGDGITCTEDGPAPPMVLSTVPADGATIRFDDGAFAPPIEVNLLIVTFDQDVLEVGIDSAPLTMTADHLDSDFTQALEIDPRFGSDNNFLRLDSAGTPFTSFPAGDYEVTIENVRSYALTTLESYTWGFTVETCGDATCQPEESTCTCTLDCGSCAGCCSPFNGGALPHSACRPGNTNSECGINGATCGVCEGGSSCVPGVGGCD